MEFRAAGLKTSLKILVRVQKKKNILKLQKFEKSPCKTVPFLLILQACRPKFPTSTNTVTGSEKKIYCKCPICKFVRKKSVVKSFYRSGKVIIQKLCVSKTNCLMHFSGRTEDALFESSRKIFQKNVSVGFLLSNTSCSIYQL